MTGQTPFDASEIYQFAIRIEENGEAFYRQAAALTQEPKVKELFSFLSAEEARHRETFESLLQGIADYQPAEAFPDDYFIYLRAYADAIIFNPAVHRQITVDMDPAAAVDFAIQREIESILYYLETRNLVSEPGRRHIDPIITEERRHFMQLSELKHSMSPDR